MNIGSNEFVGNVREYFLSDNDGINRSITRTDEERDLSIVLTPDFKFSAQAAYSASKATSILGMLKHTFISRDVEIWASLYRTYIRPHLEFAVSAWNPFLKRDILTLEKVQRRVTRLPDPLKSVTYDERLERMNLTTLEIRRRRGSLIQFYKLQRGTDIINWISEPVWSEPRGTRRKQARREIVSSCLQRHHFFLNRVANDWNLLPDDIVKSGPVEVFKEKLDHYLSRRPLVG